MYQGFEYVMPVVGINGESLGIWLVQDPRYPVTAFDNPEDACALAASIGRVVPDQENEE